MGQKAFHVKELWQPRGKGRADLEGFLRQGLEFAVITLFLLTGTDLWVVGVGILVELKADRIEGCLVNLVRLVKLKVHCPAGIIEIRTAIAAICTQRTVSVGPDQGFQTIVSHAGHDLVLWYGE